MIRKSIHILFVLAASAGLLVLLSFAASRNGQAPCRELMVSMVSESGNAFTGPQSIRKSIVEALDTLEGRPLDRSILQKVQDIALTNPYVKEARVYRTISSELRVDIRLRDPLLRVVNTANESYYVDTRGQIFPLSPEYTARVMLATGHITTPLRVGDRLGACPLSGEGGQHGPAMEELYELARYIHEDPFWRACIDHIWVLPDGKFELIPRHAAHIIEFGSAGELEGKFHKLEQFYKYGLSRVGWYGCSRLNLEYDTQVICKK